MWPVLFSSFTKTEGVEHSDRFLREKKTKMIVNVQLGGLVAMEMLLFPLFALSWQSLMWTREALTHWRPAVGEHLSSASFVSMHVRRRCGRCCQLCFLRALCLPLNYYYITCVCARLLTRLIDSLVGSKGKEKTVCENQSKKMDLSFYGPQNGPVQKCLYYRQEAFGQGLSVLSSCASNISIL